MYVKEIQLGKVVNILSDKFNVVKDVECLFRLKQNFLNMYFYLEYKNRKKSCMKLIRNVIGINVKFCIYFSKLEN